MRAMGGPVGICAPEPFFRWGHTDLQTRIFLQICHNGYKESIYDVGNTFKGQYGCFQT